MRYPGIKVVPSMVEGSWQPEGLYGSLESEFLSINQVFWTMEIKVRGEKLFFLCVSIKEKIIRMNNK